MTPSYDGISSAQVRFMVLVLIEPADLSGHIDNEKHRYDSSVDDGWHLRFVIDHLFGRRGTIG